MLLELIYVFIKNENILRSALEVGLPTKMQLFNSFAHTYL